MAEMSRGDMMRRLDGASKDLLRRLANGQLGDGGPLGLDDKNTTEATTSIVGHLGEDDADEPREDA
jgi:hypothetical protein